MTELHLTRDRRDLIGAVGRGDVHRTFKGTIVRRTRGSFNRRCDVAIRELVAAGWVRLGEDDAYELTDVCPAVAEVS